MLEMLKRWGAKMMSSQDRETVRERGEREIDKARRFKDDPERLSMALGCARTAVLIWRGLGQEGEERLREAEVLQRELEGKVAQAQVAEQERLLAETRVWALKHGIGEQDEVAQARTGVLLEGLWKMVVEKSGVRLWKRDDGVPQKREPDPGTAWALAAAATSLGKVPGVLKAELRKTCRVRRNDSGHVSWMGEVVVDAAWGRRTFSVEV